MAKSRKKKKKRRLSQKAKLKQLLIRVVLSLISFIAIVVLFVLFHQEIWHYTIKVYKNIIDIEKIQVFISSFGPLSGVVFVVLQALQVVFAPIPGELTGFIGGFLFGNVLGTILSTTGLTIGSILAFFIARRLGLKYVEKIVKKHYIEKFNHFVTHKGLYITFVLFLIPGFPKDSLCYLLGLTRLKLADFIFMNLVGRLPGTIMLTLQGTAVKNADYREFIIILLGSVALIFLLYLAKERILLLTHNIFQRITKMREKRRSVKDITEEGDGVLRQKGKGMNENNIGSES